MEKLEEKNDEYVYNENTIFDDDSTDYQEEFRYEEKLKRNLDIKKYDRMIKDIIASIDDGSIILTPDYQRNYLWDNKKASKLIESILLNIPIPVIYASEENTGKWNVVDGLQRLNSLRRFYKNEFKLTRLEILSELNGKKYTDLSEPIKGKIDRGDLSIILLLATSTPDIQYDIFMRLNSGSIKLNEQELRNCLYRGKLNDMIKNELIYNENFQKIFNLNILHKRMIDVETILRYLAFSDIYNNTSKSFENYDGRIKNTINNFMLKYQNADNDVLAHLKNKFTENIEKCYMIFGEAAFRKPNDLKPFEQRINRPLYETIMICMEKYPLEKLLTHKNTIEERTNNLLKTGRFNDLISIATGNTTKANERLKIYSELLEEILENDK